MKLWCNYRPDTVLNRSAMVALLLLAFTASGHAAGDNTIATDRPDFVESSAVVGKGRFQIETSVAGERDRDGSLVLRSTATPTLLRVGVSDSVELRLESDGRLHTWSGAGASARGYADTSLGIKWHAADAQGNAPSVGILIHADLPSGSAPFRGEGVRPSLRLVGEWELPAEMSLGLMPGIASQTSDDGRRFTSGIFGLVAGKAWTSRFRSFIEVSATQIAHARDGGSLVSFDVGVAYLLTDNCQLDTAVARGLNRNTPDLSWTVGLSFKL
jgi:hypothetical protein